MAERAGPTTTLLVWGALTLISGAVMVGIGYAAWRVVT